jgi:hypothetical protein
VKAPLPAPPPSIEENRRVDDAFFDVPATTVSAPPEGAVDDNLEFNIGEASRLVKLPILAPPSGSGSSGSSSSLPGTFAPPAATPSTTIASEAAGGERADASLKLPIASMSTEMAAMRDAPRATPAPAQRASETAPPVPPRVGRRLGLPVILVGVTAMVILVVVVLLAGRDTDGAAASTRSESKPGPSENLLINNFYEKDNPLFGSDGQGAKKTAEPPAGAEVDPATTAPAPDKAATVAARPRVSRPRNGEARIDPAKPPPAAIGPPREKVDSFGDGVPDGTGPLTPDDVRDAYATYEVGLKRCYERSLKNESQAPVNKMVVKITITASGNVSEISVPDRDSELGSCVANSIRAWRFRRSTGEFTTEFTVFFAKRG